MNIFSISTLAGAVPAPPKKCGAYKQHNKRINEGLMTKTKSFLCSAHSKNGSFNVLRDYDGTIIRMIKRSKNTSYMLLQSHTIGQKWENSHE